MKLKLIVAVSQNGVIGSNGKMPWHIPADLRRFSELTKGNGKNAVIMGRKTWTSLPEKYRPLPGRLNIVLTRTSRSYVGSPFRHGVSGVWQTDSLDSALDKARDEQCEEAWILGGQSIYQLVMSRLDQLNLREIHITQVHGAFEGDTFFPYFSPSLFDETNLGRRDGGGGVQYTFKIFRRKGEG